VKKISFRPIPLLPLIHQRYISDAKRQLDPAHILLGTQLKRKKEKGEISKLTMSV